MKIKSVELHAKFWLHVFILVTCIGYLLPALFSAQSDVGPVVGCFLVVAILTYTYNFFTTRSKA